MTQRALPFEGPVVELVRHRGARRYVIRVADNGTVRVTIPPWGSRREAQAFADREQAWIEKEQRRLEKTRAQAAPSVLPPSVESAVREQAARELPTRLLELARQHGLAVRRVSVRNQKSRWGSCSLAGHICLNWRLVMMPASIRDYVMIHELMHLKRMDHSARFWRLVARACPAFQEARAFLRNHPHA